MQQPGVTSPIIGPRTMEQFEDNMGALNVEITDDDRKADQPRRSGAATRVAPFYEAEFGPHPYRASSRDREERTAQGERRPACPEATGGRS